MEVRLEDFALFGAAPAFEEALHVGRPHVGDHKAFLSRIEAVLGRRWLTNDGPCVLELEHRIAEHLDVAHCVATSSGTTAIGIAARAAGLRGDVVVPSFTFVAQAHALAWQGLTPVFCDVDPVTHNLDPRAAEDMIGPNTSAIMPAHLWGRPADVAAFSSLAERHDLRLIFDAAHAFGCSHKGRMVGGFGDAEIFSFHATKVFNTFEGGAITTNDEELADRARLMRNFGFAGYDEVLSLGINGKLTEAAAAMGLTSLEGLDSFIEANRENYLAYETGLARTPGISVIAHDQIERRNFHDVVVEVDVESAGIARDELLRVLHAENVLARRYFYPGVHRMEPYRSRMPDAGARLPATEELASRTLSLPNGGGIATDDAALVCELVARAVDCGPMIRSRLSEDG